MEKDQALSFIEHTIRPLWPDWKIEAIELEIWARQLSWFDETTLKRAVEGYYSSEKGSFKRPKLAGILKLANKFKPEKPKEEINKSDNQPVIGYSLKCVTHPRPGMIGEQEDYYYGTKSEREKLGNDFVMRIANRAAENHCKSQGGTWAVIRYDENLKDCA